MMHTPPERARSIAEQVLEYDRIIVTANAGKSDVWEAERQRLRQEGLTGGEVSLEIAQLKSAVAQFVVQETNPEKALKAEERREGADHYLHAIQTAPSRAHVHVREAVTEKVPTPPESRAGHTSASGPTKAAASITTGPRSGDDTAAPGSTVSRGATAPREGAAFDAPADSAAPGGETSEAPAAHADGGDHVNGQSLRAQRTNIDSPARPTVGAAPGQLSITVLAKCIVSDPEICDGAPIVKGTRVRTSTIRQYADDGWQAGAIVGEFPELSQFEVAAALQFEAMERAKEMGGRAASMRRTG